MKVTYNAEVCTHAGECVKGAPNVFKVVFINKFKITLSNEQKAPEGSGFRLSGKGTLLLLNLSAPITAFLIF